MTAQNQALGKETGCSQSALKKATVSSLVSLLSAETFFSQVQLLLWPLRLPLLMMTAGNQISEIWTMILRSA